MTRSRLWLIMVLALAGSPAAAQRIDPLTGEPARPRAAHPRPEPDIVNAPHSPRQIVSSGQNPPLTIFVAPQVGADLQSQRQAPAGRRY